MAIEAHRIGARLVQGEIPGLVRVVAAVAALDRLLESRRADVLDLEVAVQAVDLVLGDVLVMELLGLAVAFEPARLVVAGQAAIGRFRRFQPFAPCVESPPAK